MKTSPRIRALLLASFAIAGLGACIFDDDKKLKTLEHTYRGSLDDLERIMDTNTVRPQWHLPVDLEDEAVLRGTCDFNGYLGDSASVHADDPTGLYTNTTMGGTRRASEFRATGVTLSMDSSQQMATLTHYRADFHCQY